MSAPLEIRSLAERVLAACQTRGVMLATAESCTGGLISGALTDVPGSSAVVERGFVTYSNEAKAELLGVDLSVIAAHGAVSEPVARAMAEGALARAPVGIAVSVTGVAGPGGTVAKPEGMVWFACAVADGGARAVLERFGPIGRDAVRRESIARGLRLILETLDAAD